MKLKDDKIKKITANLPKDLLERAVNETGQGVTETLRQGLRLVLAQNAATKLLECKGKINMSLNLKEIRADR